MFDITWPKYPDGTECDCERKSMIDDFRVIGLDHHRSPLALRERMAVSPAELELLTQDLLEITGLDGLVILSTCNRTEFYCGGQFAEDDLTDTLARRQGIDQGELVGHLYRQHGRDATAHLFRVISSLESMVVGEYQIVNQIRFAYESARQYRATSRLLHSVFQRCFVVGKQVRHETGIGKYKVSIASVAVDLAKQVLGDLAPSRLLVIGAGDMAELTITHLVEQGVHHIGLINRSQDKARDLATHLCDGQENHVYHWNELTEAIRTSDIIITSTSAPLPVITVERIQQAMRKRRNPLVIIDLAVPRDVGGGVRDLEDVYVYNLDNFEQVVAANKSLRAEEIGAAADLVEHAVDSYLKELAVEGDTTLRDLSAWFQGLLEDEYTWAHGKMPELDEEKLKHCMSRLLNKVQHRCLKAIREDDDDHHVRQVLRSIFDL